MKKFNLFIGLIILLLMHCSLAEGQAVKSLSLREALLLSLRYNVNVQNAEIQRVIDKFGIRVAKNQFELQYALSGTANYTNTRSNDATSNSQQYTLNPSATINTAIGTSIGLTMNNTSDGTHYNPQLSLSVSQPLLRGSNSQVVQASLFNAYDQEKVNKLNLKNTIIGTVTQVINDYRAWVQAKNNLTVQQLALENSRKIVEQNRIKIKAGVMAAGDNVQYQTQIANQELSLASAENAIVQSRLALLADIGLSPDTPIEISKEIEVDDQPIPTEERSKQLVLRNDIGYQTALIGQKVDERSLLVANDNARVQLNLTMTATDGGGSGGGRNAGLDTLLTNANRSTSVGLALSVPIHNMQLAQAIVNAKMVLRKDENNLRNNRWQLETKVLNTLTNLRIQRQQIEIAKRAREAARLSLEIAEKKLKYGRITVFEVRSLQTDLINADLAVISNQIAYLNSVAGLQQLLGTTLQVWGIHIRY